MPYLPICRLIIISLNSKILRNIQILAPALVPAYFPKVYRLSARAKSKLAGTLHKSAILEGHITVKT